jgi:hypothetical protein
MSPSFVREFSETAATDAQSFAVTAAACYRHCSQFIHGKLAATRSLPETLDFSSAVLKDWLTNAVSSARVVLFLLYARYGDELLSGEHRDRLAASIEEWFGHLEEVRQRLGLPTERKQNDAG